MPERKKHITKKLPRALVKKLADAYEDAGPPEFYEIIDDALPEEDVRILYDFHPNFVVFLPLLWFDKRHLVEDLADELVDRWAPDLSDS